MWKLFYLLPLVQMKCLLKKEYLFWPLFLTSQYFRVYEIFQFCKSLGFSQKQSMVPDFSMYFDMKSLSFIKINPQKVSKPLYLQELVQANKLRCQCMMFSPKLFCTFSHLHSFQYSILGHREIFKRDNFWSVFASLQTLHVFSKSKSKRAVQIKSSVTELQQNS